MWSGRISTAALAGIVVVAALGAWSCGGSGASPTAPALVQDVGSAATPAAASTAGQDDVSASCRHRKVTICHKGQTLQVAFIAAIIHLRHGDRLGACQPPAASCPCFTASGLADVAAQCSATPIASCGTAYSINLFCAPGGGGGVVGNLGYFEAKVGTNTCSTTTQDPTTGDEVITTLPVTSKQFDACKQAIIGSAYYPASCPR
jgi:hypothetical protein